MLVLGATGWFGKTTLELLNARNTQVLAFPRRHSRRGVSQDIEDRRLFEQEVLDFQPSLIVDFSFLTRDKLKSIELERFRSTNLVLTDRLLNLAKLSSVEKVMYASSGAAIHPKDALEGGFDLNPYGFLKRRAEVQLKELVESSQGTKSVSILRPWSVSGKNVRDQSTYLFSSLVTQAIEGDMVLTSNTMVYRRYVSVGDAIHLGLANFRQGELSVLDTGGELIEARDLATLVREIVNPQASISMRDPISDRVDDYFSDNSSWTAALQEFQYEPLSLVQQIEALASSLVGRQK